MSQASLILFARQMPECDLNCVGSGGDEAQRIAQRIVDVLHALGLVVDGEGRP